MIAQTIITDQPRFSKTNGFETPPDAAASRQGNEFPAFDIYGHEGRRVPLTTRVPPAISPRSVDGPGHILTRGFLP
jgi:hypothetical protein